MNKVNKCTTDNGIPVQASQVQWNGGDIDYLGICNGDWLPNIIWEIVSKLQEIAGEDLSAFDIDELLDICNQRAPLEVNITSILTLIKNNQICIKTYIETLQEQIQELANSKGVVVNLRCYADFDNLGNALSVTREQLDQLVINKLCDHESRLNTIDSKITSLEDEITRINDDDSVDEVSISTCVDANTLPTSIQLGKVADALCEYKDAIGGLSLISEAIAAIPGNWNTKFAAGPSRINGWNALAQAFMQHYANMVLLVDNLEKRTTTIERNCCGVNCDSIKIGIQFTINEDDTLDMLFSSGAGTYIPAGFENCGTVFTFTDKNGVTFTPALNNAEITQNGTIEGISLASLASGLVTVSIKSKFCLFDEAGNTVLTCEGCFSDEFVNSSGCCVLTNTGDESISIVYKTTITSA